MALGLRFGIVLPTRDFIMRGDPAGYRRPLEMAERILEGSAPAVFRLHDAMCEPATHRRWAEQLCERARLYGVREKRLDAV